ncbi:hypothetical protein GGR58DRAFT_316056 [Xylaria digitata]|nr:hypothetical protein GGR58DRAFT_316056 [Xylaria digitata]
MIVVPMKTFGVHKNNSSKFKHFLITLTIESCAIICLKIFLLFQGSSRLSLSTTVLSGEPSFYFTLLLLFLENYEV